MRYSITDARKNLPSIVKEVERGPAIELTRRGAPVAVLVSTREYQRLKAPKRDIGDAIMEWRAKYRVEELDMDPDEIFRDVRDRSPGRDFHFEE